MAEDVSIDIYETEFGSAHINGRVLWNPEVGSESSDGIIRSPASILDHELDHALHFLQNPNQHYNDVATKDEKYKNKEERRVVTGSEQKTAKANGEIKNIDHIGRLI